MPQDDWLSAVDQIFVEAEVKAGPVEPPPPPKPVAPGYTAAWYNIRLVAHPHIIGQDAGIVIKPDGSKEVTRWVLIPGAPGDQFPLIGEERPPHDYQPGSKPFHTFEDAVAWCAHIGAWEKEMAGWVKEARGRYRPAVSGEAFATACDADVETFEPVEMTVPCGEATVHGFSICRTHIAQAIAHSLPDEALADVVGDGGRLLVDSLWLQEALNIPLAGN